MSAFLCKPWEFVALARYAKRPANGFNDYNLFTRKRIEGYSDSLGVLDIALILAKENLRSVSYRYPDQRFGGFVKDAKELLDMGLEIKELANKNEPPMAHEDAFMLAGTVDYQSCETPDWIQSDACWILKSIQNDAGREMATMLATQGDLTDL